VLPFIGSEQKESVRETKNLSFLHIFLLQELEKRGWFGKYHPGIGVALCKNEK